MPGPLAALGGAVSGFALPLEGARLLLRERRLWGPALVPLALSVAAVSVTLALVVGNAGSLYGWITGWMPQLEAARWYAWLWIGPALLLLRLGGALLFLLLLGVCLVAAYLLASLLAAPFHDVLSRRVEQLVTGDVRDEARPGWRGALADAAFSLIGEGRRIACFAAIVGPLVLVGFAVPAAHVVTGPLVPGGAGLRLGGLSDLPRAPAQLRGDAAAGGGRHPVGHALRLSVGGAARATASSRARSRPVASSAALENGSPRCGAGAALALG
jgi:uncharacterized protein involved in cysteine biosynthesis